MYVIPENPSGGSGKRQFLENVFEERRVLPHGETSQVVEHLRVQCQVFEEKRVEAMIGSIMGTDYDSFWRNRDMDLVQGPVDCLR